METRNQRREQTEKTATAEKQQAGLAMSTPACFAGAALSGLVMSVLAISVAPPGRQFYAGLHGLIGRHIF